MYNLPLPPNLFARNIYAWNTHAPPIPTNTSVRDATPPWAPRRGRDHQSASGHRAGCGFGEVAYRQSRCYADPLGDPALLRHSAQVGTTRPTSMMKAMVTRRWWPWTQPVSGPVARKGLTGFTRPPNPNVIGGQWTHVGSFLGAAAIRSGQGRPTVFSVARTPSPHIR